MEIIIIVVFQNSITNKLAINNLNWQTVLLLPIFRDLAKIFLVRQFHNLIKVQKMILFNNFMIQN